MVHKVYSKQGMIKSATQGINPYSTQGMMIMHATQGIAMKSAQHMIVYATQVVVTYAT